MPPRFVFICLLSTALILLNSHLPTVSAIFIQYITLAASLHQLLSRK